MKQIFYSVTLTYDDCRDYPYFFKGAMTRYAYATVAIAHAEACMTSRLAYNIRLCAPRNSTERVSALPGLPEPGRDPPLRTLGRRISMPRATQVLSVTVEAHTLRHHTSARRVERKCEIRNRGRLYFRVGGPCHCSFNAVAFDNT